MAQNTDLYLILRSYARRNNSPYIDIDNFLGTLERHARKNAPEHPEWNKWAQDTSRRMWEELPSLFEQDRCKLISDELGSRILMVHFYTDAVRQAYESPDDSAELPFPDEESLRLTIPEDYIRPLALEYDFAAYLDNPQDTLLPMIKLIFPENKGSAILLADMIPRKLLETAMLKIRHYLRSHSNKEYVYNKISPQLQGKESQLREALNQILTRPFDSITAMENSGDFEYYFWAYFVSLVKNDIKKKNELLSEDIAALQSAAIIEVLNGIYKSRAVKRKERELAFKNLELELDKPPFIYTMDKIVRFTDNKGVPLLGQYSQEDLEAYLKTKTTHARENELPELLIIHGVDDERWFVKKRKMLPLCARLLSEARPLIRKAISKHWLKLIKNYEREEAMDNDEAFEKELIKYTNRLAPELSAVLEDPKLLLVYEELEAAKDDIPATSRIFNKGVLISMSELLLIRRKDLLTDTQMLLPFWYSISFFTAILSFFRRRKEKKRRRKMMKRRFAEKEETGEEEGSESQGKHERGAELREAAKEIEKKLVPEGHTLDSYLAELQDRWSRLLNRQARENLIEDVNSLIRDHLRRILRIQRNASVTEETVNRMSSAIISETPALQKLGGQDSLILYIQLYIVKLLGQIRI